MARRGGYRRNWITRQDAGVFVAAGRWGYRRARVTECWCVLKAEDALTGLLKHAKGKLQPGGKATLTATPEGGESFSVEVELRPNAVWRMGRAFFKCPHCYRRCTRIYLPRVTDKPACRVCWGLTYQSRQENYKGPGAAHGGDLLLWGSHRLFAEMATCHRRDERAQASVERWARRREILKRLAS